MHWGEKVHKGKNASASQYILWCFGCWEAWNWSMILVFCMFLRCYAFLRPIAILCATDRFPFILLWIWQVHLPSELKPEKYPHFMERENQYKSTSILGQIYDMVKMFEAEDVSKGWCVNIFCNFLFVVKCWSISALCINNLGQTFGFYRLLIRKFQKRAWRCGN